MRKILLLTLFLLCRCVTMPGPIIETGMQKLYGQPIKNTLFFNFNYPTAEGTIAGKKFYVWSTASTYYSPGITTTTGYATTGSQSFNYAQTTYGAGSYYNTSCTLRVFVDREERITNYDIQGNNGACKIFAAELDPNYKSGF